MRLILFTAITFIFSFFTPVALIFSSIWALNIFDGRILSIISLLVVSFTCLSGLLQITSISLYRLTDVKRDVYLYVLLTILFGCFLYSSYKVWFDDEFIKMPKYLWLFRLYITSLSISYYYTVLSSLVSKAKS